MSESVLIVAHPDDEILWFSSIIESVDKIIILFSKSNDGQVSEGRKKISGNNLLPYAHKVLFLNIDESNSFNKLNWDDPKIDQFGAKISSQAYKKNYYKICNLLKDLILPFDVIYTHNPWGEYGHEEHIQIFKSIIDIANLEKQQVCVSGYFSERSYKLMDFYRYCLKDQNIYKNNNRGLCNSVKKIYYDNNAWTWADDYSWPQNECFFRIDNNKQLSFDELEPLYAFPVMNFIRTSISDTRLIHRIKKNYLLAVNKNFDFE